MRKKLTLSGNSSKIIVWVSINESISDLSAVGEEVAASSQEGASVSANALESTKRVNHELRQIRKLAAKLTGENE